MHLRKGATFDKIIVLKSDFYGSMFVVRSLFWDIQIIMKCFLAAETVDIILRCVTAGALRIVEK